jgi:signal recognition particle subunit SEC65
MPRYFVSVCIKSRQAESNPFGHTFLALSQEDPISKKLQVLETWGFYGVPPTAKDSSLLGYLQYGVFKIVSLFGVETDVYGNHGILTNEKIRQIDMGRGIDAISFELPKDKYAKLSERCAGEVEGQYAAINEAAKALELKATPANAKKRYPQHNYEASAYQIFQYESKKAADEKRESRLHEFALALTPNANSCKVRILEILDGILDSPQIKNLTGWCATCPRSGASTENVYWHSTGPISHEFKKADGEVVHHRKFEDKDVKLFWTLPPQLMETLSPDTKSDYVIDSPQCKKIKDVVKKLQAIELVFRNAVLDQKDQVKREEAIEKVVGLYQSFSTIPVKIENLKTARTFLQDIYNAIICDQFNHMYFPASEMLKKKCCAALGEAYKVIVPSGFAYTPIAKRN